MKTSKIIALPLLRKVKLIFTYFDFLNLSTRTFVIKAEKFGIIPTKLSSSKA